jgi:alcohol dehydrogenase class IV
LAQLGRPVHEEKDQVIFKDLLWELFDQLNMPKCLKDLGLDEREYLIKLDKYCHRFETNDRAYSVAASVPSKDQIREIFTSLYYGPKGR